MFALALALVATTHDVHILLTTDEHGWLSPLADKKANLDRGGVVRLFDELEHDEGYAPGARGYVLLSAGDMWTGPFESTGLEGAPMVAAMSRMGYAAAAVGNHEFDFGTHTIAQRAKEATFPLLACNLVEAASGKIVSWAKPFTIVDVDGVKLGVVGLTNIDSPVTADARHMTGLKFRPYAESLDEWIPKAKAAGAQEIVVLIHEAMEHEKELMPVFRKHHVRAVAMGHHHVAATDIDDNGTPDLDDDVTVCNGGAFMRSYCRIDLKFDDAKLIGHEVKVHDVTSPLGAKIDGDAKLVAIVSDADKKANEAGGEALIENVHPLPRGVDSALGQFVVDAWLDALPYAQAAVTNSGGLRQDLEAGTVRVRDVQSVLPFNNTLIIVNVTGAQLKQVLAMSTSIVSGVKFTYSEKDGARVVESVVDSKGKPIADDAHMKVVINEFMYRGGDHYPFGAWDKAPEETAIDWRAPVLRRLRDLAKAKKKLDLSPDDRAKKL